jgi:hypothetical protein
MTKKIKKEKEISIVKPTTNKSVQIPLAGVIIFSVLLAASSFFAGAAWLKMKGTTGTVTPSNAASTFEPSKSDKPDFQFYVMSFCPYGNQMEDLVKPIAELLGNKANIRPQYIFEKIGDLALYCKSNYSSPYQESQCPDLIKQFPDQIKDLADCKKQIAEISALAKEKEKECNDESKYIKIGNSLYGSLHGRVEANQNVREICAFNMNDDKTNWWKFVDNTNKNCTSTNADTCWEEQAKKAGFDTNKITECFNTQAAELIDKEIALTTQFKIQGSPTLKINGVDFPPSDSKESLKIGKKVFTQDQYRSSDAIKEAICASFNKVPKECKTEIKAATVDTTATGGNAAPAAAAASCN